MVYSMTNGLDLYNDNKYFDVGKFILCAMSTCVYFLAPLLYNYNYLVNIYGINVLFLSLYLVYSTRKNILLFLIFCVIMYANYSIIISNYILEDYFYYRTIFVRYFSADIIKIEGLKVLFLFMIFLVVFIKTKDLTSTDSINFIRKENLNIKLLIIFLFFSMLISIFAFGRPESFGERGAPSALYEYSVVLLMFILYHSGRIKIIFYLIILFFGFIILQNVIYGGRVTAIQLILIFIFMIYYNKLNYKLLLFSLLPIFILMVIVGIQRANLNLIFGIFEILFTYFKTRYMTWDTAYSAYHTSLAILNTEEYISVMVRLKYFLNFMIQQFLGSSFYKTQQFHLLASEYFPNYGGCILPHYFHFMLGIPGVIFSSYLVSLYCNILINIKENSRELKLLIAIYISVTSFRWYLYSPFQLIRGVFLIAILCSIIKIYKILDGSLYKSINNLD